MSVQSVVEVTGQKERYSRLVKRFVVVVDNPNDGPSIVIADTRLPARMALYNPGPAMTMNEFCSKSENELGPMCVSLTVVPSTMPRCWLVECRYKYPSELRTEQLTA